MEHPLFPPALGRLLLISAIAVGAAHAGAPAAPRYSLRQRIAVGDRQLWETTGEVSLALTARAGEKETPLVRANNRFQEKYREDVLAAPGGTVTRLRHQCLRSRTLSTDTAGKEASEPSSLEGKSFTILRRGGQILIRPAGAAISAEDRAQLARALAEVRVPFLPNRDAVVGEEWAVPPPQVRLFFPQARAGSMTARFQEVTTYAGRPCAHIHLTGRLALAIDGVPAPVQAQLTGDLYHALDIQRPVALEFAGPLSVDTPAKQDGQPIILTGAGRIAGKVSIRWESLATPVSPARAASVRRRAALWSAAACRRFRSGSLRPSRSPGPGLRGPGADRSGASSLGKSGGKPPHSKVQRLDEPAGDL